MDVGSRRVADTYADRSVFVTGASGFLGKVLVEKLLYSASEVKNIYLLIRPLKGQSPKERLDKLLQVPIFDRVRHQNEKLFKKLVPVAGDLMDEGLGLSQADMQMLCDNVSIVFHCAATVKFDEALRVSVQMNVVGTRRLIALCHKMKHLISVVHASTAYANCDLSETEERVYKPPVQPDKLIETTEWMSDDMLEAVTPKLLGRRPNTYTFAKALAESQLIEDAKDLPVIILRPSIIGAMWKEPLPGWTDNLNGPTGIFAAVGKGIIGNMCGSGNSKADIIPVDVVSNALIVAAAYRAELKTSEIPVIHCCSGELNPLKWGRVVNFLQHFYMKYPLDDCYRVPSTQFHTTRTMFLIHFYLKHYYPSQFMDIMGRIVGRKPSYVKLYGRVWKMVETLHYFTTRGWTFKSDGLVSLWNTLNDEDKKTFNFDVRQIDWDRYLFDYVMGVKVYLLREKLENLPKARSNLAWLKQISLYTNAAVWGLVVRLTAWKRTQKEKWTVWLIGFLLTYFYQNYNFRPSVYLKTLEEYKKTALMA